MAESKFNLSDSNGDSRVNPLIVGAAVIGAFFVGAVVAVKFFTGQSEESKKITETPTYSPQLPSGTLVDGLQQHLLQAKKMEEELVNVKAENKTQQETIEAQKKKIQTQESALLQKDTVISGLTATSKQQAEELRQLNLKFAVVKEENDQLKSQVAKFQSVGSAFLQVSQNAASEIPKPVKQTPPASPSELPDPIKDSDSGSAEQSFSDVFSQEKFHIDEKDKNAILQSLATLCSTPAALNSKEVLSARYMMVLILFYKNEKTIAEILEKVKTTIGNKLNFAKDLPKLNPIFETNKNMQDQFEKRSLTMDELKLFSKHFSSKSKDLPDDSTAVNLFGDKAQRMLGKTPTQETTLDSYEKRFLGRLKPATHITETPTHGQ